MAEQNANDLPGTLKRNTRQIRKRSESVGDLISLTTKKSTTFRKKHIDALKGDKIINAIIPVLTEKLSEVIETHIKSIVDSDIKPLSQQKKQYLS